MKNTLEHIYLWRRAAEFWSAPRRGRRLAVIVLGCLGLLALISMGRLVAYEVNPRLGALRGAVGSPVVVVPAGDELLGRPVHGTLKSVKYRFNDKVGFFDLEIDVQGRLRTGLGPLELDRVRVLDQGQADPPGSADSDAPR